ncbi:MAG: hypothetical protein M1827_003648 [Pycnora praestabilis]|nr:MAG: hypothetical protein M1827_003648 [Pycnora praestabilis]
MASSLSLLHFLLFSLGLLQYSNALPHPTTYSKRECDLSSFTLPQNGGPTELPSPLAGLTLKVVALGVGTQNYTCTSGNSSAAPLAVGALATLFDADPILEYSQTLFNTIPSLAVYLPDPNAYNLPALGHHYFSANGTPTFNLGSTGFLSAGKVGDIPAPASAGKGVQGEGAVDWLALTDKGGSVGLKEVYRVETAGGKAPATCANQPPTIQVEYSAQYWFYA